jgi:drug/metabolite transporter (DMT)-like permease
MELARADAPTLTERIAFAYNRIPASWLMVLSTLLFATMGVCVKVASSDCSTGEMIFYRGLIGVLGMFILARAHGVTLATQAIRSHLLRSLVGVASMFMWFYALQFLPMATAVTLNSMSSLWIAVLLMGAALFRRRQGHQPVDPRALLAILAGFIGVALVLRPSISSGQIPYAAVGLASGFVSALAYLQVGRLAQSGEPELRIVFYFSVAMTVFGLVASLPQGLHHLSWAKLGVLLCIGLSATLAQLLLTRAYNIGRALTNASLQYLGIGFACLYGVTFFSDKLTWMLLSGIAMIVCSGIYATTLRISAVVSR